MSKILIVFAKSPELGKVKTRLAATIGNEKALEAYQLLVKHTETVIASTNIPVAVYFTHFMDDEQSFCFVNEAKHVQVTGDLGDKMKAAFQDQFEAGNKQVVIVGTDCYELKKKHIEAAFESLNNCDVVVGPANDGGYYLLGSNTFIPSLFENITWSTESVLTETLAVVNQLGKRYELLETLVDVDYEHELGDLKPLLFK